MTKARWYLFFIVFYLFWWQGDGIAETMYVTDRLYLSLRSAPDLEQPATTLLPSDTKLDVLATEGDWAHVKLEDGKTGWVLKRFLVTNLPKSLIVEELKRQIENKNIILERLQEENASRNREVSDRDMLEAKQGALQNRIETLKRRITQQKERLEVTDKEHTVKRLKEVYVTGIVALFLGLITGYLVRRPKKKRYLFS